MAFETPPTLGDYNCVRLKRCNHQRGGSARDNRHLSRVSPDQVRAGGRVRYAGGPDVNLHLKSLT